MEGEKRSRELEEASEGLPSHDPRSLSTDYELPRSPRETPKSTPEEPRRPPRDPEEHPKEAQESPKTISRPSSDRKRRFFKNRAPAETKSRFSRVGGSSWELKIDPKRVEEENKHVLEEDLSQRSCQESSKKLPKRPRVTIHRPCRVIMTSPGALRDMEGTSAPLRRT